MMDCDMVFEPLELGTITLRNRIVRSATAERLASEVEGAPWPQLAVLYEELAAGGAGTIVTGHCYVERDGKAHQEMASLAKDSLVDTWAATIAPAKQLGARVIAQINHSGASANQIINPYAGSPSGLPTNPENTPRAVSGDEIERVIRAFSRAAGRAKDSGFDGVQIHAAHGYLISQFLSPKLNLRDDEWGGSAEARRRFGIEVVRAVRAAVGAEFPVWMKLGVADRDPAGLAAEEGAEAAAAFVEAGVDCIEISHGFGFPDTLRALEAPLEPLAGAVRKRVGPDVPLSLVHGIRTRETCERLLASRIIDLVSFARPFIVEPGFVERWRSGSRAAVSCVRCDRCWPESLGVGVRCNNAAVRRTVEASS